MLGLFEIAWKELKFIKTQRLSLLLIFLYPLIIVFSLGAAFSQADLGDAGLQEASLAMYVPPQSEKFDHESFVNEINESGKMELLLQKSPEAVKEAVRRGWAKVGLVVHEPGTQRSNIGIDMYYDNTTLRESQSIVQFSSSALQLIAYRKSAAILNEMWDNMDDMRYKLDEEMQKTDEFISRAEELKTELQNTRQKINSIDLTEVKSDLESFDYHYGQGKNEITSARANIADAKNKLAAYRVKVVKARDSLVYYRNQLSFIRNQLATENLWAFVSQLDTVVSDMDSTVNELNQVIYDIDESNQKLEETDAKLVQAESMLDQSTAKVQGFRETVSNIENTINEVNGFLDEAEGSRFKIARDLKLTKGMLGGLVSTLDEFRGYDPSYIAKPIVISALAMYEAKDLAIMIPIAIAIVLLLTCMLLTSISVIEEKKEGINLRVALSPTKKITWLSGKIIGQMVFALAIALVISVIAILVFQTPVPENIPVYLTVLAGISFSFICMGVFLTNFIKTQTNAILASLLILVPMLFLSGTLFPIEFMPSAMKAIAHALPLTIANNLILGAVIRGSALSVLIEGIGYLVGLGIVLLVFSNLSTTTD